MSVVIRLARAGTKKRPVYHVVVADSRFPRDGRFIERLGHFNPLLPKDNEARLKLDMDKVKTWLAKGAQPSDRVSRFLDAAGVVKRAARNNPEKALPRKERKANAEASATAATASAAAAKTAAAAAAKKTSTTVPRVPAVGHRSAGAHACAHRRTAISMSTLLAGIQDHLESTSTQGIDAQRKWGTRELTRSFLLD